MKQNLYNPKLSRNEFLRKAGLVVAGSCLFPEQVFSLSDGKKDFIIIGAGLAGCYAAYLLSQKGHSVALIEAGQRPGGRVRSEFLDGLGIASELGGSKIYSYHTTTISLAEELNIRLKRFNFQPKFLATGKHPAYKNLDKQTEEILKRIILMRDKMSFQQKKSLDALDLYSYLKYQGIRQNDLQMLDLQYSFRFGESIRNVSAEFGIGIIDLETFSTPYFRAEKGNIQFIHQLLANHNKLEVIYSDPVIRVQQNRKNTSVELASGRKIAGSYCICTVPTTVIEKIDWQPDFDKERKMAFLKMKYGRLARANISFTANYLASPTAVYSNYPKSHYFIPYFHKGKLQTLEALYSEGVADHFYQSSRLTKKKLVELGVKTIDIFQTVKLNNLVSVAWSYEPYIYGGRSFFSPGTIAIKKVMRKPHKRVFFAGEHLGEETGTMNSALESAATLVQELLK